MNKYLEKSGMVFYSGKVRNEYVNFIPAITIQCSPPYVKGKLDGCWIKYNSSIRKPNFNSQADCERLVGMRLQPLKHDKA